MRTVLLVALSLFLPLSFLLFPPFYLSVSVSLIFPVLLRSFFAENDAYPEGRAHK